MYLAPIQHSFKSQVRLSHLFSSSRQIWRHQWHYKHIMILINYNDSMWSSWRKIPATRLRSRVSLRLKYTDELRASLWRAIIIWASNVMLAHTSRFLATQADAEMPANTSDLSQGQLTDATGLPSFDNTLGAAFIGLVISAVLSITPARYLCRGINEYAHIQSLWHYCSSNNPLLPKCIARLEIHEGHCK